MHVLKKLLNHMHINKSYSNEMDLHLISLILVVKRMLSSSLTVAETGRPI